MLRRTGLSPLQQRQQAVAGRRAAVPRFSCTGAARLEGKAAAAQRPAARGTTVLVAGPALQLSPAAFDLEDVGDLLIGHDSSLVREARRAVHQGQRLEQQLQRCCSELPVGVRRLLAGGLAGAAGKTSTAPLETIKMQLVQSGGTTAWQAAAHLWSSGGAAAFFRGNSVDVLRTVPSRALELSTYEWLKQVFRRWNRKHNDKAHIPDKMVATLAGGLAGVVASMAVYPLETARTRLALSTAHSSNFVGAIAGIVRTEGAGALFKGLDASLVGVVPYAAIRLGSYDAAKAVWRRSTGRKDIDAQAALLFGAFASMLSAGLVFPLEVARRRMMAGAAYPHVAGALATIWSQEGAGALFNGVLLSVVKQAPQGAITFATYEVAKQFFKL